MANDVNDSFEEADEIARFDNYKPSKFTIGKPHPDPLVQAASMAVVEMPDVDNNLSLPSKVLLKHSNQTWR